MRKKALHQPIRKQAFGPILTLAVLLSLSIQAAGSEHVQQGAGCAFAKAPAVVRQGDQVTIAFETRGFCDVTVAIEDASGKIVRHLACGVLGSNVPAPFTKGTKSQTLVWDGKDDQGCYVDDKDNHTVRVSLGLKARYERPLFWEPKKRVSFEAPLIRAAPEGVYVYEGRAVDHLRLFAHNGRYIHTIYPFPSGQLDHVKGLQWSESEPLGQIPLKLGSREGTLLTSGPNGRPSAKDYSDEYKASSSAAASALAVQQSAAAGADRGIALVRLGLCRLATDGTSGGLPLTGPEIVVRQPVKAGDHDKEFVPHDAAFSPDGKTLYLAGYMAFQSTDPWHRWLEPIHGVTRLDFDGVASPTTFKGVMTPQGSGRDNEHFNTPVSIDCDAKGNVYVADYLNDRVQIFRPDGGFLRTVSVTRPALVRIHRKTGDIYVFSWILPVREILKSKGLQASLTVFGPMDDCELKTACPIAFIPKGWFSGMHMGTARDFAAEVDGWTDPPTIWFGFGAGQADWGRGDWGAPAGVKGYTIQDGKLVETCDFGKEAVKSVVRLKPPRQFAQHLFVNPATGKLYVLEYLGKEIDGSDELVEIDPATGRVALLKLPWIIQDVVFDSDGHVYFVDHANHLFRCEFPSLRQVPFDYGEEASTIGPPLISCIPLGSFDDWHHWSGKIAVSLRGGIAASVRTGAEAQDRKAGENRIAEHTKWSPRLYPGRRTGEYIHIWDKYGKILHEDALQGLIGWGVGGLALDTNLDLVLLVNERRAKSDEARVPVKTGTLIRVEPGKARLLAADKAPVSLLEAERPRRPADLTGDVWLENARWIRGGLGFSPTGMHCLCWHSSLSLDYFGRCFVPEPARFEVAVLDANGNRVLRVGRYGNADDGVPLEAKSAPPSVRPIGGDEVALFSPNYVAVLTDTRLFIADAGNGRIVSVKLSYHAEEKVALKDVPDEREK